MRSFQHQLWIGILILFASLCVPIVSLAQEVGEAPPDDSMVTMDFQDVELSVLVKFISELTGKNFIIDDTLKGKKVTVISPTKITKDEAYKVFESILDIKGFSTVPAGKVIKIIQTKDAVEQSIQTVVGNQKAPVSDTLITRLIPLAYVPAEDLVNILKPLVSKESKIDAYPATNTIVLTDSSSNIARLLKIIKQLDIQFDEMTIEVILLEYASADTMAKQLQDILQAAPAASAGAPGQPPVPRATYRAPGASGRGSTKKGEEFAGKIIPDGRTNSLVVLATKSQMEKVKELVAKLDYDTPKAYGNINVYYLEYAKAEDTAKVLNELVTGTKTSGQKAGPKEGIAPGLAKTLESFEKEVSITSDTGTNSLLIVASPRDYQTLKNVIEKLDIRRNQVYVEAVVMEITPGFSKQLGFEYRGMAPLQSGSNVNRAVVGGTNFSSSTTAFVDAITGTLSGLTSTPTSNNTNQNTTINTQSSNPFDLGGATGLTLGAIFDHVTIPVSGGKSITLPANIFLLHALASDSYANVLSTPHMLAINNEEAEIVVGQNVPFVTSTSQSTISTMTSISRENVGITLRFTPQINESDFVFLKLYEEISSLIPSPIGQDVNTVGPTTSTRKATNSALVKNGQTIVIGGLIEDRINKSKTKVPWLGDIPFLGWLFRYNTNDITKTNLLIFLTPTIVKEDQEVQRIYQDKKKKMQEFKKRQNITDEGYDIDPFEKDAQPTKGKKEDNKYKVKVKGAYPLDSEEDQAQQQKQP